MHDDVPIQSWLCDTGDPLTDELEGKVYYGCITNDFYLEAGKQAPSLEKRRFN